MTDMIPAEVAKKIGQAIALIRSVPGYEAESQTLAQLLSDGKIRYVPTLEDRAHAGLLGTITLGPEPFAPGSTILGLAETLIHERHHLTQNPLEKTVSFWTGVATKSDVMARYEKPAYQAAATFLERFRQAFPALAAESDAELFAVRSSYESSYGEALS
ncbi:MAG: hypothetical protein H8F28_18795 [Fibrella sp.]|nr:hypothetical protein [Armatimonadota bacterium]